MLYKSQKCSSMFYLNSKIYSVTCELLPQSIVRIVHYIRLSKDMVRCSMYTSHFTLDKNNICSIRQGERVMYGKYSRNRIAMGKRYMYKK